MKPTNFRLKKYTNLSYKEIANLFDNNFTTSHFQTSHKDSNRVRYEVSMPEIDFFLNRLNLGFGTGCTDAYFFKNSLFNNLKKIGWQRNKKIRGRYVKYVFL